jgi:Tfp pilus assembly protein PilN
MKNPLAPTSPMPGSFLPEDYITRRNELRANLITLSLFAVVLAGVVGGFVVTTRSYHVVKGERQRVEAAFKAESAKIEEIKKLEAQRAQMMEKAEITATLSERIPRWALLGEVVLRMPRDMKLETFHLKSKRVDPAVTATGAAPAKLAVKNLKGAKAEKGDAKKKGEEKPKVSPPKYEYTLTLSGSAEHNSDIADFLTALRASPVLESIDMNYIRESKEKDRELRKFEFTGTLKQRPDSEVIASSLRDLVAQRTAQAKDEPAPSKPRTQTNAGHGKGD